VKEMKTNVQQNIITSTFVTDFIVVLYVGGASAIEFSCNKIA